MNRAKQLLSEMGYFNPQNPVRHKLKPNGKISRAHLLIRRLEQAIRRLKNG